MKNPNHREFISDYFWQKCSLFEKISKEEFLDYQFQIRNSVYSQDSLLNFLKKLSNEDFITDVKNGFSKASMSVRISPYLLSLINWDNPYEDPIRKQFIPVASSYEEDHPQSCFDSLSEQKDSPLNGLIHRYPHKVLFLPLDVCPVYCRFCTRSYAIGADTSTLSKVNFALSKKRWMPIFEYLKKHSEIEDVVISGGDIYMLPPHFIRFIGQELLQIEHIRRFRFATKGLSVMPMKILTHPEWVEEIISLSLQSRKEGKEICIHTHFNSVNEITSLTKEAVNIFFQAGVPIRNQSVLIRGVNDSANSLSLLLKKLSFINIEPYYVYQHDMVKGVEEFRTSIAHTQDLEKQIRGTLTGFHMPRFVVDLPKGGGKREIHSFESYDKDLGISVWKSPNIDKERKYFYFDPLRNLSALAQKKWRISAERKKIIPSQKSSEYFISSKT